MTAPAVVVAAPASGSGKTTVATGLMGALRRAGRRVVGFKTGPDFIDPSYHALAAGRPGRNLDPVLVGEALIGPLYRHGCVGADTAVIEGVMGLFDGRIDTGGTGVAAGSTAHVAGLLGAPVVLVVDARGQSHSLAALLYGFSTFAADTRIVGVVLNRVGSARHEQVLRQACDRAGVAVLGAIPRLDAASVPSRHLGLVNAAAHGGGARAAVAAMTDLVARHVDVAAVAAVAAARAPGPAWDPQAVVGAPVTGRPVVAMAAGAALGLGYREHAELLCAAGADVAEFDPRFDALPSVAAALVLPGGFPEDYAAELSANRRLRRQVAELAGRAPVHAEGGGLAYLATDLDGEPMCGALAATARFSERLRLGYRDAVAVADSSRHCAGERVVGHEFHRITVSVTGDYPAAWRYDRGDGALVRAGAVHTGVHAADLHIHPAARPAAVRRFVGRAATDAADTVVR